MFKKNLIEDISKNINKAENITDLQELCKFKYIEQDFFTILKDNNSFKKELSKDKYMKFLKMVFEARKRRFTRVIKNQENYEKIKRDIDIYFKNR